jgi:Zn-dependent peptidase ImmA (M78 family)/DNA-binding XRE family transcriptional regulator
MTKGINDLQPARLEQALAARGLTKGQLASLVGVSASTVTKWCKGDQAPEAETFDRLASVLNVQPEWLARPLLQPVSTPLFRSYSSALKSGRAKLEAHTEWSQEIAVALSNYVEYPDLNLPEYSFSSPDQIQDSDIESAAAECRTRWNLGKGPIQNLALAAEGAGILVVRQETEISVIEGLSAWSIPLRRPIVFLSADKANGFRSRFDLAHELGHLILHKHIPVPLDPTDDPKRLIERHKLMEAQAHQFAGALLLPAETFSLEVRVPTTLDNLLILKQRWGVSVAAMMMRLHALELLSDAEKLTLFKRKSARWGSKSEPGDEKWEPEAPRLLRRTVELLINEGILSPEDFPRFLGLSARDVENICYLRDNFFAKPSEVIELTFSKKSNDKDIVTSPRRRGEVLFFSRRKG